MAQALSVAFIGPSQTGKSTLIGHYVSLCSLDKKFICRSHTLTQLNKARQDAIENGRPGSKFSWMLDSDFESRNLNKSLVGHSASINKKLKNNEAAGVSADEKELFLFLHDSPGDEKYLNKAFASILQSDVVVLMISSDKWISGPGPSPSVNGEASAQSQSPSSKSQASGGLGAGDEKEKILCNFFALTAFSLGIKKIIVLLNKFEMTDQTNNSFNLIKEQVCKNVRYKAEDITFIPVSAFHGDNLLEKSNKFSWYSGPCLQDALESLSKNFSVRAANGPLRIPISKVYKIKKVGVVVCGRIEAGTIKPGTKVSVASQVPCVGTVSSIQVNNLPVESAQAGTYVGLVINGLSNDVLTAGSVLGEFGSNSPSSCESFEAQIMILNDSPYEPIAPGLKSQLFIHSAQVNVTLDSILYTINKKNGEIAEKSPRSLKNGDVALVSFTVEDKNICVELFSQFPTLGRFVLKQQNSIRPALLALGSVKARRKFCSEADSFNPLNPSTLKPNPLNNNSSAFSFYLFDETLPTASKDKTSNSTVSTLSHFPLDFDFVRMCIDSENNGKDK